MPNISIRYKDQNMMIDEALVNKAENGDMEAGNLIHQAYLNLKNSSNTDIPTEKPRIGKGTPIDPRIPPMMEESTSAMGKPNYPFQQTLVNDPINKGVESIEAFAGGRPKTGISAGMESLGEASVGAIPAATLSRPALILMGLLGAGGGAYMGKNLAGNDPENQRLGEVLGSIVGGGAGTGVGRAVEMRNVPALFRSAIRELPSSETGLTIPYRGDSANSTGFTFGTEENTGYQPQYQNPQLTGASTPQIEGIGQRLLGRGPIQMPAPSEPIPLGGQGQRLIEGIKQPTGEQRFDLLHGEYVSPKEQEIIPTRLKGNLQDRLKKAKFKMEAPLREGESGVKEGEQRFKEGFFGSERGSFDVGKSGKPLKPPTASMSTPERDIGGRFKRTEVVPESVVRERAANEGRSMEDHIADNPHYRVKNRIEMMRSVHARAAAKGVSTKNLGLSNMSDRELHSVWANMKSLPDIEGVK